MLHMITYVGHVSFGLGMVATNLARSQAAHGARVAIACLDGPGEIEWAARTAQVSVDVFCPFPAVGPSIFGFSKAMEDAVAGDMGRHYDVLHQHSLWTGVSRASLRWRLRHRGPMVISPQGALDQWALRKSHWKKELALLAYERANLANASCIHALSRSEVEAVRAFGLRSPVAVIENGVSDTWLGSSGDARRFREAFSLPSHRRLMLFLSRVTPKKGIPMLLEALSTLHAAADGWLLVIAGPDEFNHEAELRARVQKLNLTEVVRFVGPLYEQTKRDAFAAAELFVLPSHSEGAPIAILEALGAGVPVLTTEASPWGELITHDCGWWTKIAPDAIAQALELALAKSPAELGAMGARGRALVADRFTWQRSAERTLCLYEWLLGRATRPDFVVTG